MIVDATVTNLTKHDLTVPTLVSIRRCPMRKQVSRFLLALGVATFAMFAIGSTARAVNTMADWAAQNTHAPTFAPDNNYDKINNTTVGGQVQSKINFNG